ERAQNTFEAQFLSRLERVGGFGGKADQLNFYNYFVGTPDYFQKDLDRYRKVTAADVQDAVRRYLVDAHRVVLSVVPQGKPEGAGGRGALEIADEAAFLGAQLNTSASYDAATVSLHVPRRRLEPALDLLTDVVLRPTFADSEVARQRELRRAQIVQLADNPVAMAGIAFPAIVYGRAHPYGRPLNGTEASTAALSRDRVAEFYRAAYRPNVARILVTGDVTLVEV